MKNVRSSFSESYASIDISATLGEAARAFRESRANDLMVVDAEGQFLGVLSEGDLLRAFFPDLEHDFENEEHLTRAITQYGTDAEGQANRDIAPLVIRDPIKVGPDHPLLDAALVMNAKNIRRLPVVEDGRLLGTISRADICCALLLED